MKGDADTKYMVKETIYYSDGSERTIEFTKNPNAEAIEKKVREDLENVKQVEVSEFTAEEFPVESEVTGTEPVEVFDNDTLTSTE